MTKMVIEEPLKAVTNIHQPADLLHQLKKPLVKLMVRNMREWQRLLEELVQIGAQMLHPCRMFSYQPRRQEMLVIWAFHPPSASNPLVKI